MLKLNFAFKYKQIKGFSLMKKEENENSVIQSTYKKPSTGLKT